MSESEDEIVEPLDSETELCKLKLFSDTILSPKEVCVRYEIGEAKPLPSILS